MPALVVFPPRVLVDLAEEFLFVARRDESLDVSDAVPESLRLQGFGCGGVVEPVREFGDDPVADRVVDGKRFEHAQRRRFEGAFGVVPSASLAAPAPVVHVPSLLLLTGEEAVARAAAQQSGVRERVVFAAWPGAAVEDVLDILKERLGNEWLVLAKVSLAAPDEGAGVDGVLQEHADIAFHDVLAAPTTQADTSRELREIELAVRTGRRGFEEFDDEWCFFGVRLDAFRRAGVAIPEWRPGWPTAFGCFLVHAFLHFFAEVLDVVLGHEHAHAGEEAHAGVCLRVQDRAFLDEVDREAEAFERAVILEVPREPVDFLDDEVAHGGVVAEEGDHRPESRAPGGFGGFVIAELDDDLEVFAFCVVAQEVSLCRNAKAFFCLLLAAHARVEHGLFTRAGGRSFLHVLLPRQHALNAPKKPVT